MRGTATHKKNGTKWNSFVDMVEQVLRRDTELRRNRGKGKSDTWPGGRRHTMKCNRDSLVEVEHVMMAEKRGLYGCRRQAEVRVGNYKRQDTTKDGFPPYSDDELVIVLPRSSLVQF